MDVTAFERLPPPVTDGNAPYWDGLAAGELRLQCCDHDNTFRFPESPVCPACLSANFTWRPASGQATLWSWILMHQQYFGAYADERPYVIAFVELAEGPLMISTVVADPATLVIDEPLQLDFKQVGKYRLPVFTRAG